ncbi:MAG: MBL fold metallo-hydrolase [Alkalispirochaetaceae bacterium]
MIERIVVGNLYTNSYIASVSKKECLLIDPGADVEKLIQRLEAINMTPLAIVFTHGHIDHTGATRGILDHFAQRDAQIQVGIHKGDDSFLGASGVEANKATFEYFGERGRAAYEELLKPLPEADFYFDEGDTLLETDLTIMHTPGHTRGSVSIYSESRKVVFSGDTLFFHSIGRSDVPLGDADTLKKNITERLFTLPEDTRLFPGHGPVSTIEREIMNNPLVSDGATI